MNLLHLGAHLYSRPFTGARVETFCRQARFPPPECRPFTGARVETVAEVSPCISMGRPFTGARVETQCPIWRTGRIQVAPSQGRELKLSPRCRLCGSVQVAPSQGRELKHDELNHRRIWTGRPFTGARVETRTLLSARYKKRVAPSQGRELKLRY